MAPFNVAYVKILVVVGLVGAALVTHLYVRSLKSELAAARFETTLANNKVEALSEAAAEQEKRAAAAEEERAKVRADLAATLARLRSKKPPVECAAAIKWAIDNKGDLKW